MRRFFSADKRPAQQPAPHGTRRRRRQLEVEVLEERSLLAVTTGSISGTAFLDSNGDGVRQAQEALQPGIPIDLSGTSNLGQTQNTSATTDVNGKYTFQNVPPGTYHLSTGGATFQFGDTADLTLTDGQTLTQDLALRGPGPLFVSLRQFLTSTKSSDFAPGVPGGGTSPVAPRANNAPTVAVDTPIPTVQAARGADTVLDLAGFFSDQDMTNSIVELETSGGPVRIELFDTQAPRTVANFFNYINSGRYNESIFHRSADQSDGTPFVLQGGGFTFATNPSRLDTIPTDPDVLNEPDTATRSNLRGTVAMAKLGGDPNSATDQFFFNLSDNSDTLDNQNSGFTVFGKLADDASQDVVDTLAAIPTQNQSAAANLPTNQQGVFGEIPLQNYSGTAFPTDTVAANYAITNSGDGLIGSDLSLSNGNNSVINDGEITGTIFVGTGNDTVTNRGLIVFGVSTGSGIDTVTNSGIIGGSIGLGDDDDFYDGRAGTIFGGINTGAGSDTVLGGDGVELIFGGDGDDTVDLGAGNDSFFASAGVDGDDFIDGGLGLDTYDAANATAAVIVDLAEGLASGVSVGTDQLESIENLVGSALADSLIGSDLANILEGLSGTDILIGAAGDDMLEAGDGADIIAGGVGRDLLSGGGADNDIDLFDFNTVVESGITAATRDRVTDFEDGFDKIDLLTIDAKTFLKGNQAFKFIDDDPFTAAGGQIRASITAQGNTLIQINTDHDKAAEMSLLVLGTPTLNASDFIL